MSATTYALLRAQAKLARRRIGQPVDNSPDADGVYGGHFAAAPLSLVVLGDSSAAGLGVHRAEETPGAVIAAGVATVARRPVRLTRVAKVGARSDGLERQVTAALQATPHVAVVMIGGNDVTHRVRPSASVRHLVEAVGRLRQAGCEVVVGTCPDLGTIQPIAQPLRLLARQWSRQLAAAQTIGVVEAGGRTVSLGDLLGPEFAARPLEMFGPDRFHPSAAGYRAAAEALLPSVLAALGLAPAGEDTPDARRGEGVRTVAEAAVAAADTAGTEVTGAAVAGRERGPRGRWALLLRRRPEPVDTSEATGTDDGGGMPGGTTGDGEPAAAPPALPGPAEAAPVAGVASRSGSAD
ncbi:SGNH/GDSL hydrolase family protein [Motilibacter sp. K478]|nr:SGNH/GDSL hydrolase family protein [Motilibacter aurantiacus]NHC45831.1 SGNH/GDSL hydrolase family protein [Motilibacter aurantiacus]